MYLAQFKYNTFMPYNQQYGNVIWTNHALERLHQRKLPQHIAYLAFQKPDERFRGKNPGTWELQRKYTVPNTEQTATITLIVKQNERKEWLILSAWIDPPIYGTADHKKREAWKQYKKSGFWGKLWYVIKKQLGLIPR